MATQALPTVPQAAGPVGAGTTLVAHILRQVRTRPDRVAMYFRAGERWAPITWGQFGAAVRRMTAFLVAEGVGERDGVAIWANNRPEWHIADAAVICGGMCPVPVYVTLSAEQAGYVLGHSESRVAFVESREILDKVLAVREQLTDLRRVVVMSGLDRPAEGGFAVPWTEALARGETALQAHAREIDRRSSAAAPDDVATLIYTSGTTGPPKAVKLTHRNLLAAATAYASFIPADEHDRVLSYLPLAHIAERGASEFRQYVFGNPTYFAASIEKIPEHLRDIRPTLFFAVPRVWEKMAASIRARIDGSSGARRTLARWALRTGMAAVDRHQAGRPVDGLLARRYALADRLVLRKVREAIGLDQATILASGAAPIAPDVLRFFAALGLEIDEVYGQTENTGAATMNRRGRARFGTVGPAIPGVEVRIAGDGEILVRGDVVFAGYHKDEKATAEAVVDGWLHTGDVGEFDADGCLRITDRKKDIIITAGGKNIAPSNIESALKRYRLVGNAVVIGDRRPFVSALLTLDADEAVAFARERGMVVTGLTALSRDPVVLAEIQRCVGEVNATLSSVEQVKRWTLLERDFAVGEELTPTLKVRRKVVVEKYAADIEANYSLTK